MKARGRSQDKDEEGRGGGAETGTEEGTRDRRQHRDGSGTETRAVEEKGKGTGAGMGNGSETGKGARLERKAGKEERSGIRHIKTRHCYSARSIVFVDMRWSVQLASSFGRKIWRRLNNAKPREKQAPWTGGRKR